MPEIPLPALLCGAIGTAWACLIGYLLGSIPFGVIVARWKGVDIREVGSGNIGATNVARGLGKGWGALVLFLDAAKGYVPVAWVAHRLPGAPEPLYSGVIALVGFSAVLGHVFPVWLFFKGGKGVATALGVLLAVAPSAALVAGGVYAVAVVVFRIGSIGSLVGTMAALVTVIVQRRPWPIPLLLAALTLLIVYRHTENLRRLFNRTEHRF
jgi:glycerol-3-phosphate acyltransferase PlsY